MKERDLRSEGVFIAEGRFLVERALASGLKLHSLLTLPSLEQEFKTLAASLPKERRPPVFTASQSRMEELCGFSFHRGVLAAGYRPIPGISGDLLSAGSQILVCSDIRDPFNLGGLFRTAAALDWDALFLIDGCADPLSRAGLRASMGASFSLPWMAAEKGGEGSEELLAALRTGGYALAGAVLPRSGSLSPEEWLRRVSVEPSGQEEGKLALMVGNEGSGLPEVRVGSCDLLFSIPMTTRVDSLNVGVAAGILMYSLKKGHPGFDA